MANPYAAFVGDRDPRQVIESTAGRLKVVLDGLGVDGAERPPAPGKWNARQIVTHLADCELAFAFRLRQALAEDYHVIQPFDQDRWAAMYDAYDSASALAVFTVVRGWNLRLIGAVPASAMEKKLAHPERGEMTFQVLIETMAGHDLNHLAQLDRIAAN